MGCPLGQLGDNSHAVQDSVEVESPWDSSAAVSVASSDHTPETWT